MHCRRSGSLSNFRRYFVHNLSSVDHMQVVLLFKEQDFKDFAQDLVFARLVEDLHYIENPGGVLNVGQFHILFALIAGNYY